jgi:glycerophosphoryl diester phosphodiesterase
MIVLSHRGYWKDTIEKNTRVAFERSFSMGFGTETDVRDRQGQLVISHDIAGSSAMPIEDFFAIYRATGKRLPLALNIKADGLQQDLKRLLLAYDIQDYFVFDMAVPDGLLYARQDFLTYTRHSEFETSPAYYDLADGVWLDEFEGHWITDSVIKAHLAKGKSLCIVSPDLHKRDNTQEWKHYRELEKSIGRNRLMLCTDFPEQAQEYFNA